MSDSKISIITPSKNHASFIASNIESVLSQGYSDVEHIISDGGSTDGTLEILKKYPHLKVISERDRGQSHALNKGFRMASGEIIGWINSDDGYCPNVFQDVADRFQDPNVMVVYGEGIEVDEKGAKLRTIRPRGISSDDFIRFWRWKSEYIQASFFFRRSVFDKVGYIDESLYYTMDHEFFIRLSLNYDFTFIPKELAFFRLHESSKTGKTFRSFLPKPVWELLRISKKYWGTPLQAEYYRYVFSFLFAIVLSFLKNLFFIRGAKSRVAVEKMLRRS